MVALTSDLRTEALAAQVAYSPAVNRLGLDGEPVPLLRGRLHEATAVPVAVIGTLLALGSQSRLELVAISIFTASIVAMLTASAAYHCHTHTFEAKLAARRLDHAMIFVAIGGTQTAYWLIVAPPVLAILAIATVWLVAGFGIHHKLNHLTLTKTSGSWLYIALGWTGVALVPFLVTADDLVAFAFVIGGGLIYTMGGLVLSRRFVDPWPAIFGYHEVWHTMVIVGVLAHGLGIVRLTGILG